MSRNSEPEFTPLEMASTDDSMQPISRRAGNTGRKKPSVIIAIGLVAVVVVIALIVGIFVVGRRNQHGYDLNDHTDDGVSNSGGSGGSPSSPGAGGGAVNLDNLQQRLDGVFPVFFQGGFKPTVLMGVSELLFGRLVIMNAMFGSGDGVKALYHMGLQENKNWFTFQRSPLNKTIDLVQPQLDIRLDHQSSLHEAFKRGVNTPHIRTTFPYVGTKTIPEDPATGVPAHIVYLLDITAWMQAGFTIAPVADSGIFRLLNITTFKENIEFDLQLILPSLDGEMTRVHFSLALLPETGYKTRISDDRLGFFTTDYYNFGANKTSKSKVSLTNRWRLEKKNPGTVSDPVKPITYYLDPTIPPQWRPYVKKGVENWKPAFEAAGFTNAIRAVQPGDADWPADFDAGDIRYSTISWVPDLVETFGLGPSDVDPRTGEILNADIMITSGWTSYYEEMVAVKDLGAPASRAPSVSRPSLQDILLCKDKAEDILPESSDRYSREEHRLLYATLLAEGVLSLGDKLPVEFAGAGLTDVVMHEVGHTLGLRHNFKGSRFRSYADLSKTAETRKTGLVSTVMDYTAVNIPADRSKQGEYFTSVVGPYDILAIKYGYSEDLQEKPGVQSAAIKSIADEVAKAGLEFATDEDGPRSTGADPFCSVFDIGKNPLDFYEDRNRLVSNLWDGLLDRVVQTGDTYFDYLTAALPLMSAPARGGMYAAKFLGGVETSKSHKNQPSATNPIRPIQKADQDRALALIISALTTPAMIPNRSVYPVMVTRDYTLDVSSYDVHNHIAKLRMKVLGAVFDASRVSRIRNTAWAFTNQLGLAELVDKLSSAHFPPAQADTYDQATESFHRDAQLTWVEFCLPIIPRDSDLDALLESELDKIQTRLNTWQTTWDNTTLWPTSPSPLMKAHYTSLAKKIGVYKQTGVLPGNLGPAYSQS